MLFMIVTNVSLVWPLRKIDNKIKISEECEEMDGIGYVLGNLRLNKGLTQKFIYNIKWFVYILKLTSKDRLAFLIVFVVLLEKRKN